MRKKKVAANLASALTLQIVALICGFIVPRLILVSYGSAYNGIVNSVNQFLACVTLLRAGVGGVVRAALYKPLNENRLDRTAEIVKAAEIFMRKIGLVYCIFLIIFAGVYPIFVKDEFRWTYTFTLVLVIGISTAVQYFFGITYSFLLQADQKLYIYNLLQILTYVLNTIVIVILIRCGFEFRIVRLASSTVFCITPLVIYAYVRRMYRMPKDVLPDHSCIRQRWDAFAHQAAAFVHNNTDLIVLTVFSSLYQVSVYSVYYLVINGIRKLIDTCSGSIEALFGNMIANRETRHLKQRVIKYEWTLHMLAGVLFGSAAFLIVPFVMIYTRRVTDVDYANPAFAYLICLAEYMACIRLPYQNLAEAAGHFKQTKKDAITEAVLNILISVILVSFLGILGVAAGTLIAMTFRTCRYAAYVSRVFLERSLKSFFRRLMVSLLPLIVLELFLYKHYYTAALAFASDYYHWVLLAVPATAGITIYLLLVNAVFYRDLTKEILRIFSLRLRRFPRR